VVDGAGVGCAVVGGAVVGGAVVGCGVGGGVMQHRLKSAPSMSHGCPGRTSHVESPEPDLTNPPLTTASHCAEVTGPLAAPPVAHVVNGMAASMQLRPSLVKVGTDDPVCCTEMLTVGSDTSNSFMLSCQTPCPPLWEKKISFLKFHAAPHASILVGSNGSDVAIGLRKRSQSVIVLSVLILNTMTLGLKDKSPLSTTVTPYLRMEAVRG
jgi:hypothetical protein